MTRRKAAEDHKPLLERIQTALQGSRQRRADDRAAHRFAGVPRQRRARPEHESGAHPQGGGAERAGLEAGAGDQPDHPIVKRLKAETDETRFADWSHILFDQATLAEGGQLEDPAGFVKRLNELMLTLAGGSGKPEDTVIR